MRLNMRGGRHVVVDVKKVCELWRTPMGSCEIAAAVGLTKTQLWVAANRLGLPKRPRSGSDRDPHGSPTPEEIAERAAAIRAAWPEGEAEKRLVGRLRSSYRIPHYSYNGRDCAFQRTEHQF